MSHTSTVPVTTGTLQVPDARLYYEVRGSGPLVALVGAPMDARPFAPLADLLAAGHTVLTTDPRAIHRSSVEDRDRDSTPEMRADDLARLLVHLDAGRAVVLGSSGGAVTALALAQARPELVRTVVAHEPPLTELLDDRDARHAATDDMIATYVAGDPAGAWGKFFANAGLTFPDGEMPVGDPDPQQLRDERFWFEHEMRPSTHFRPDVDALRTGPTRIVVGIGEESAGQFCDRTSTALAAALGTEPAIFPGGHIGFAENPVAFAGRLRAFLVEG